MTEKTAAEVCAVSEKQKKILCLGDSNTFGYDPAGRLGGAYPPEISWIGRLQSGGWQVINNGINGSRVPVQSEFSAFAALIESRRPLDLIMIMYGTNDVLQEDSAQKTGERMAQFLSFARRSADGTPLLLVAPPPLSYGDWVQDAAIIEESRRLSGVYRRIADTQKVLFADAGAWAVSLAFDGVHFTPEGHEAFFRGLVQSLKETKGEGGISTESLRAQQR